MALNTQHQPARAASTPSWHCENADPLRAPWRRAAARGCRRCDPTACVAGSPARSVTGWRGEGGLCPREENEAGSTRSCSGSARARARQLPEQVAGSHAARTTCRMLETLSQSASTMLLPPSTMPWYPWGETWEAPLNTLLQHRLTPKDTSRTHDAERGSQRSLPCGGRPPRRVWGPAGNRPGDRKGTEGTPRTRPETVRNRTPPHVTLPCEGPHLPSKSCFP